MMRTGTSIEAVESAAMPVGELLARMDGIFEDGRMSLQPALARLQEAQQSFSDTTRSERMKKGWDEHHLAEVIGAHIAYVHHLENLKENDALPSWRGCSDLERILGIEADTLSEKIRVILAASSKVREMRIATFKRVGELALKHVSP